jgi:hypothetical protein
MKKHTKNLLLMTIPALCLAGFSFYRPQASPTLTFARTHVVTVSRQQQKERLLSNRRANALECIEDTSLFIEIKAKKLSFPNRYWQRHSVREKPHSAYLLDSKGNKYTSLPDITGRQFSFVHEYGDSSQVGTLRRQSRPVYGESTSFLYRFYLSALPASSGKLTFHVTYIADDGFQLPVSVQMHQHKE